MSIQIKLKNSVVQDSTPSTSDLPAVGELALNANINSIGGFMRASNNTIVKIFGPGSLTTPTATTTVSGIAELATSAETTTGSATNRVVTPAGLNAVTVAERTTSNNNYVAKAGGAMTGVLTVPAGTNTAPGFNFGDTNSGLFAGGANNVSLTAGGTTRLVADTTGVAVTGTLAVTGSVTATGALNIPGKIFHVGDIDTAFGFPAADTVSIETGGSEALRVDSSRRLLVGNSSNVASRTNASSFSPQFQLSSDTEAAVSISRYTNSVNPSRLALQKGRGTIASKAIVLDNDTLGEIIFSGWDGDTFTNGAKIEAQVNGTPGDDDMPGCLIFKTTADGSAVPTERLRIDSNGDIYTSGDQVRDNARLTLANSNVGISTLLNLHNANGSGTGTRISSNKALVLSADFDSNTPSTQSFIAFETDGTEKIRITQDGSLGIGESNPAARLHVKEGESGVTPNGNFDTLFIENNGNGGLTIGTPNASSAVIAFADPENDNPGQIIYRHADNSMSFFTAAGERLRITSTGNVGIGTASPQTHLVLRAGNPQFTLEPTANTQTCRLQFCTTDGTIKTSIQGGGSLDSALRVVQNSAEVLRIDTSGNVGIGTSAPESPLHVHGSVLVEDNLGNVLRIRSTVNNGNDPNLHFEKGRGGAGTTTIVQDNDDLGDIQWRGYNGNAYEIGARFLCEVEGTPAVGNIPARLIFQTKADGGSLTTRMHIGSNGRVGIATGSPSEQLHVAGNILASGSITPNSDIAFKKDIEPLTNVLNKITQLFGVNFRYKNNNEKSMGLLAQDVEKVFPELIRGEEGEKSLNYMGLTGAIVEAIKELSDKVSKLEGA